MDARNSREPPSAGCRCHFFKDINDVPVDVSLSPRNFTRVGPHVYFTATTYLHGTELWRTDGTAAGTSLVLDIRPGLESSDISNLTNVNGTLYFTANDGTSGRELWRSDGSPFSTRNVADLNPGPLSSNLSSLTAIGDLLYFVDGSQQLRVSNRSTGATQLVRNITGAVSSLTNVNDTLFFVATTSSFGSIYTAKGDLGISQSFTTSSWRTTADVNGTLYYANANSGQRYDPTPFSVQWFSTLTPTSNRCLTSMVCSSILGATTAIRPTNCCAAMDFRAPPCSLPLMRLIALPISDPCSTSQLPHHFTAPSCGK